VPHVTIEYMIMLPVLVLQIFLFPLAASWLMNIWVDSRRTIALQEAGSHLGSEIQQIYFSLNNEAISAGTLTQKSSVPPFIDNFPYIGTATLRKSVDQALNTSEVLEITLELQTAGTTVSNSVILGQNVLWQQSIFMSNSTNAGIVAVKYWDGSQYAINMSFTG
jgi:hypothetical protein